MFAPDFEDFLGIPGQWQVKRDNDRDIAGRKIVEKIQAVQVDNIHRVVVDSARQQIANSSSNLTLNFRRDFCGNFGRAQQKPGYL